MAKPPSHLQALHKRIIKYLDDNAGPGYHSFSQITTHIFISNWEHACDIKILKENSVKAVLTISLNDFTPDLKKSLASTRIEQLNIAIDDTPQAEIRPHLESAYNFIHKHVSEKRNILIHCQAGVSRSPTFVIYYLMRRLYMTNFMRSMAETYNLIGQHNYHIEEILKFIKLRRPAVNPNPGFIWQLLVIEHNIKLIHSKMINEQATKIREKAQKSLGENEELAEIFMEPKVPNLQMDLRAIFHDEPAEETKPAKPDAPKPKFDNVKDFPAVVKSVLSKAA